MGVFDKLFGGKSKQQQQASIVDQVACPHAVLVPRWDNVHDMGYEDKATRFMCEACHEEFSPAEAEELRQSISERMQASLEEITEASAAAEESKG